MSIFNIDLNLSCKEIIKKLKRDVRVDTDKIFDGYNLKGEYKLGRYIDSGFVLDNSIGYEELFDRLAVEAEEELVSYIKEINSLNYILGEGRDLSIIESYSSIVFWPIYSLIKKSPKYIDLYIESYSYTERYYTQDYVILEKYIEDNYKDEEGYINYVIARIFGRLSTSRFLYEGSNEGALTLVKEIDLAKVLEKVADEIYEDYISQTDKYFYPSERKINGLKYSLKGLDFDRIFEVYREYSEEKVKAEDIEAIKKYLLERDFTFSTKLEDIDNVEELNEFYYSFVFEELREKNRIDAQTALGDVMNYGKIVVNEREKVIANLDGDIYLISDKESIQEVKLLHQGDYENISLAEEVGGLADYICYEWYDKVEVYSLTEGKIFEIDKDFRNVYLGSKGNYIYFETFETPDRLEVYSIKERRFFESIQIESEDFEKANIYFVNGKIVITFHKDYIEAWINTYSAKGELLIKKWKLDSLDNLYKKNLNGDELALNNRIYNLTNKRVIGNLEGSIQDFYIKVEDRYYGLSDKKLTVYKTGGSIDKFYDLEINAQIEDIIVRRRGLIIDLYLNTKELFTFTLDREETRYKIIED